METTNIYSGVDGRYTLHALGGYAGRVLLKVVDHPLKSAARGGGGEGSSTRRSVFAGLHEILTAEHTPVLYTHLSEANDFVDRAFSWIGASGAPRAAMVAVMLHPTIIPY